MAAPVVVSKGTASAATTATVTPSYPASVGADDIVFLLAISNQPVSIGVINTPTDFAEVAQGTFQNNTPADRGRVALFWRRATGSLTGTVSVTRTGDTGTDGVFFAQMYRVTGCVTTGDPWDAVTPRYGPGNATVTFDAVTVSGTERTLLAFCAQADNASTVDPPASYSGLVTDTTTSGTDAELRLLYLENQSSGPSTTATGGETEGWATFHVAVAPPAIATLTPSSAGVTVGAEAPALSFGLFPDAAGLTVGASEPSLAAVIEPSPAGLLAGAQTPTLAVELATGPAGISVGLGPGVTDTAVGGFDADADSLRQATDLPANVNSAFTITGVMKRTSGGAAGSIAGVWAGSIYTELSFNTAGDVRLGSNAGRISLLASFPLDEWYYFAITNSGGTRVLTGYVQPVAGGALTSGTTTNVTDTSAATYFYAGGGNTAGLQLRGSLTEVRFWTRELSQAEVEAEWASSRTPVSSTNLVGHYPLLDDTTKLDALVGGDLAAKGAGAWTTVDGPFAATGLTLLVESAATLTPSTAGALVGAAGPSLAANVDASPAGAQVGAQVPTLAAVAAPASAGALVGAQAPSLTSSIAATPAGALVNAHAPSLAATVSATAAGALAGAQAPTLTVLEAAAAAGALVGAQTPALAANVAAAPAGALVGASAPSLVATLTPGPAGAMAGAQLPTLTAVVAPGVSGTLLGAHAPELSATITASAAGLELGAWSPSLAGAPATLTPAAAGAFVGAHSPALSVTLAPVPAGLLAGAPTPSIAAQLAPELAGVALGAWAPALSVIVEPATAGLLVGASAPIVGELVPHYVLPGELAGASVVLELAAADVIGATARASVIASPATAQVATPAAGATPS